MITSRIKPWMPLVTGVLLALAGATPIRPALAAPEAISGPPRFLTVDVSGPISTNTTWTLENSPYIVTNDVTVNSGVTLTIDPGVVVKFTDIYDDLIVNGTLIADATATDPIYFTSINDHTVGGNTGTGTPAGGDWGSLSFSSSSTGNVLDHVTVRYGGGDSGTWALVRVQTRAITISSSTFAYGGASDHGLFLDNALPATLSNNTFTENGYDAVHATLVNNAHSITLSNNHASGNRINGLAVEGTLAGAVTWDWIGGDSLPFVVFSDLTVPAGATLALTPGTVLKFESFYDDLVINGTLVADASAADLIHFTSIKDDAVGGDTNDDGSTSAPAGANWGSLSFSASSAGSILDYVTVRYGGGDSATYGSVVVQTRAIAITNSTFAYGGASDHGIYFNNVLPATLSNNTFTDNGFDAVHATLVNNAHSIALSNNHASGNRINGFAVEGTLAGAVTWDWDGGDSLPFVVFSDLTVPAGATLSLSPGTALKIESFYDDLIVNGTLLAQGTSEASIVFTSIKDDTIGGDTNDDEDGSTPAASDWGSLWFTTSSTGSVMDHTVVSYGGGDSGTIGSIRIQTANIDLRNSTIAHSAYDIWRAGVWVDAVSPLLIGNTFSANAIGVYAVNGAQPELYGNAFISNTRYGVYNATPAQVIDARENWWSDASGPYHASANPTGGGDTLSDGVLFSPWVEALAWRAPQHSLLHGTETIAWTLFGADAASASITVTAIGPTQTVTLGDGLAPDDEITWNTTAVNDGWHMLDAQVFDGTTLVDDISRGVLVLNSAAIAFHAGTVTANQTWDAEHIHILLGDVTISTGIQVTVAPGAVVKAAAETYILVKNGGTLDAQGTIALPIILTSLFDDVAGGDTNLDRSATVPRPGDWHGIATEGTGQFTTTAYTYVRYYQRVHSGTLSANQTWEGDVVHRVTSEIVVPAGTHLTIAPDAVVKFDRALGITVQTGGELLAQGTRAQPVYFTSVKDDTLGGDSNLDGALTSPTPGDWRGILSTGGQVTLDHAILHYGGGTTNGIWSSTAAAVATTNSGTLRVGNSMIRDPYFEGVIAWGSGDVTITNTVIAGADRGVNSDGSAVVRLTNCTLDDNRVGLYGHGGNLLVTNAIIANSLAYGIDNVLSSPITLRYSDVWSGQGTDYYHMADQTGTNGNLSVDPVFKNRATGIFLLQYVSPMIDAADGVEAPSSDALGSQRYDDPRTPNTGVPTGTGAYADIGAYEFVETAESPVDLVVASIDAPSTLVAGEWITVTWTIRNDGTEPATGPWHDVIALVQSPDSRPTTVEVAEVLIGEGISLAPGHPYVASAHVRVPGAQVGEQFWQVTGNSRAEIFEGRNITNNVTLAEYPATLSFEALVIDGGATTGAFTDQEQRHWFRFTPQAGQNVRVSLDLASTVGTTELYLGVGYIPSPDGYDVRSPEWQMPDSHLSVAEAVSTTYYMLAYGTAPGTFEIRAASYAFSLDSVSPSTGGNAGQVTLLINGEAIPLSPTVTLVHTTAGDIAALATHRVGADCVAATFDLNGVAPGVADVRVSSGSTTRSLSQAFSVVAGGAPDFWWSVDGPDLVRSGRLNEYTVTWGNQGAIDAPVHLMALSTSSLITMTLLIPETGEVLDNGFQFLAMTPNAAVPSIPPGATGSFRFAAVSDGFGGFTLEARAIGLDDPALASAPIDWDDFRDYTKPDELTDEQWDAVFDALIADLGANWADVGSVLASDGLASFLEPDSPLFPRSDGVGLRIPLLRALDRGAADLGWTDDQDVTAHRLMELATERPGRLLSLSVTISGYEKAPQTDDLAGVRVDRENIRNYLTNTAQALPGNQTALDQPIGSDGALMRADIRAEVQRLAGAATDQDTLFFYFSGHGTIADLDSSGAFVDALGVGYEYDEFVTDIRNTQAKNVVVIVDACHSESLINAVKFDLTDPLKDRLTIIASSAVHQTSGLDDDEGSYLSTELAGRLRGYNGNRLVSLKEAFDEIPRDLDPDPAVQTPRWYGPDITLHDPTTQSKEGIVRNLSQRAPVLGGVRSLRGVSGGGADPNDKTGGGYGTVGWVQAGQQLLYTIHFENIPPAGVPPELVWPVQEIVVTDQLSPDLDWSTFALGTLGFNNTVVAVPPGRMTYEGITRVSTDPNPVMITATLNTQTGLITWRMHAYEDLTGQLPEDPLAGFLPANDETHTGEGYVTFSIRPKAELAQGSAFTNRADIIFDVNAPIVTNVVTNTLDTARPSSTVASLPATVSDPAFSVSWSGSDLGGSGVDLYDIYVSDDGTPFTLWQSAITTTQAVFAGASGHTYGFYSVATDHVGHRETAPTTAQATTTVQTGTYVYLPLVIRNF